MDAYTIPYLGGTLPACTFTKNGETFISWNTKADGTGTSYENLAEVPGDESLTLYAIFAYTENVAYVDATGSAATAERCCKLDDEKNILPDGCYFAEDEIDFSE